MRYWLPVLLLVLLPLQFSWAAVGTYCGHDTGIDAAHSSAHDHVHQAASDEHAAPQAAADPADTDSGTFDLDCCHCHGYCTALPMPTSPLPVATGGHAVDRTADEATGAHLSPRPDRPQWACLA